MKASVVFFLLGITASAVLSNPINDVDVTLNNIGDNFVSTITTIMDTKGTEYEDVKEPMRNTLPAFIEVINAAQKGEYNEKAVNDMAKHFEETILAMNNYIQYDGDDLSEAIKTKIEGLKEAVSATRDETISKVYEGVYKDMSGYIEIFTIFSTAADVDVSEKLGEMEEYFYRLFVSIREPNSNDYSDAESAAKAFSNLFAKIVDKSFKAVEIDNNEEINELVSQVVDGFQGTAAAAAKGKVDDESIEQTIAGWGEIISSLNKYAELSEEELSTPTNDAAVGFKEAANGAASRSLSGAVKGVRKALSGFIRGLQSLADKLDVDISEELNNSPDAYYSSFNDYDWENNESSADASS